MRDLYLSDVEEIVDTLPVKRSGEFDAIDLINVVGFSSSQAGLGTAAVFGIITRVLEEVETWASSWSVKPLGVFGEIRRGEVAFLTLPTLLRFTEVHGTLAQSEGDDDLVLVMSWIDMVTQALKEKSPGVKIMVDLTEEGVFEHG